MTSFFQPNARYESCYTLPSQCTQLVIKSTSAYTHIRSECFSIIITIIQMSLYTVYGLLDKHFIRTTIMLFTYFEIRLSTKLTPYSNTIGNDIVNSQL